MAKVDAPMVSIVIPTYNRAKIIPETLDSIKSQRYENWECIIIDDGSTDNTEEVIRSYIQQDSRFKYFKRPSNYKHGSGGARNYGLTLAQGEFIQQFDSDDLMHKDLISEKVKIFNDRKACQTIISRLAFFQEGKPLNTQNYFNRSSAELYEDVITYRIPVWTISVMFRKQFIISCSERYDEDIIMNDDLDFYGRIFIKYPHETFLLDKPLCYVRRNNEDAMTTRFNNNDDKAILSSLKANEKLIKLLIQEKKLNTNLTIYFSKNFKNCITKMIKISKYELADSYAELMEIILTNADNHGKLIRFRLALKLHKLLPIDNMFLTYRRPLLFRFLHRNVRRAYKVLFKKGYLESKLNRKFINLSELKIY